MSLERTGTPVGAPLREAKQAMRLTVAALRDALDPGWRAHASESLVDRIAALPTFRDAHHVLLTAPFRSEWNAAPLVDRALDAGKIVALPRVDEPARMLELCRILDPSIDIVAGHRGIPEPAKHCEHVPAASIDWVLVPGVAFDRGGGRLGYGGGYYDRLLPMLPERVTRVAGAFSAQLVDAVPYAPHDITMDTVVTESGVVYDRIPAGRRPPAE